jgi:hypothetical protein
LIDLKTGRRGQFSPAIKGFFYALLLRAVEAVGFQIEIKTKEEAKRWGIPQRTINRWLKFFCDRGWLRLIDGRGGRGRGAIYEVTWLKHQAEIRAQQERERREWQEQFAQDPYLRELENADLERATDETSPQRRVSQATTRTYLSDPKQRGLEGSSLSLQDQPSFQAQDQRGAGGSRPSCQEERAAVLRSLDDGIKLVKGSRFYRWVCEQFRLICWHGGASRGESDLICDAIGRLIDGRSLGFARRLAVWLMEHITELLCELRRAIVVGLRAAYRAVNLLILRAMGLVKFTLHYLKPKPRPLAHRWAYDLNDCRERKEFLRRAREIAEAGGGPCPRCGQRIERRLLNIDSGIAFEEEGLCRCIYIALDRALQERDTGRLGWEAEERLRGGPRRRAARPDHASEPERRSSVKEVERWREEALAQAEEFKKIPSIDDFKSIEEWAKAVLSDATATPSLPLHPQDPRGHP